MKIIFLFFLIVHSTLNIENCFCQWVVVSNQGNEAVSFPSVNIGYSTANGVTKKTTNGGVNWSTLSGGNLTGIFFINDLTGWVVGYPGYIAKTTNGGTFIQQQMSITITDRLNDVFFINENTGWVVGGDYSTERIFKTTNGGTNWDVQTSGTANKLFSVYFIDANTGWSVGGPSSPKIIKTTNGGINWFTQTTSVGTPLYSVMFADANTGWAVAGYIGGETIIKTTNGGQVWFSQSSGDTRYLRACFVKNALTAFAAGQGGKLIATSNGGINWTIINTGSTIELWSIKFANDSVGYAIGDNVVLKTTNGGLTFISEFLNEVPKEFKLFQNYPNPFNPTTKIKFEIPTLNPPLTKGGRGEPLGSTGGVSLKIYDITGREISTLLNESLSPGTYEVAFNGTNLPGGVYFYKLTVEDPVRKTGNYSETRKMMLLK